MTNTTTESVKDRSEPSAGKADNSSPRAVGPKQKPGEVGGPKGPEPTRYGDWEVDGRCTDF